MNRNSLLLFTLIILFAGCDGGHMEEITQLENHENKTIKDVPESAWKKLAENKIYFGHQSVGYNIIDGINDIMHKNPQIEINIVDTKNPAMVENGIFAHSEVGQNTDPISKLADFAKTLDNGMGNKVDYAFMKFCYVDFTINTDVRKIFQEYKVTYENLKKKYPNTTFIHVTTPLTSKQTDVKTLTKNLIKRIIGRPVRTYKDNLKRNEFNQLLLNEYNGNDPVFNLAKVESTYSDGKSLLFTKDGEKFPVMITDYTYDGGHLNENGRKNMAEQFLIFLANLPEKD